MRRPTIARMEGRLRRIGERAWEGELHGYRVHIAENGGQWYVWLMPGGEWTERCLRADSFGHAAWLARAWIEKRGDKRLTKK
jgi:hypothetical protein